MLRIRTLLLGVALLPLAGLTAFVARDAFARWQVSRDAQTVMSDADLVDHFLTATDAMEGELTAADSLVTVASLGLDSSFVSGQFGREVLTTFLRDEELFAALVGSVNGIAQGLQNTG